MVDIECTFIQKSHWDESIVTANQPNEIQNPKGHQMRQIE